jgi:DegV family protein with EDD domain
VIALVTDSNAMLPEDLRRRFDVEVVPLTVVIDGEAFAEGVDVTTAAFYARLAAGSSVSTAAPSPGMFLQAYERAASRGAAAALSVHIGANTSATLDSARLAAREAAIPVELVDTGTASFPVACCVWAAGLALERGAGLEESAAAARAVAEEVGNVFVVGAADLARRGGRLRPRSDAGDGQPVVALRAGTMEVVGNATDMEGAVEEMDAEFARTAQGRRMRVGVGDAAAPELAESLAERLQQRAEVVDLVRYAVGPSVAAHTGLGTAGAVYFPAELTEV